MTAERFSSPPATTPAADVVNALVNETLQACSLVGGALQLLEPQFLALGKRIHEATDRLPWSTALLALAKKLDAVDGAGQAQQQVTRLAAIALGDVVENGALCKKLYGRG